MKNKKITILIILTILLIGTSIILYNHFSNNKETETTEKDKITDDKNDINNEDDNDHNDNNNDDNNDQNNNNNDADSDDQNDNNDEENNNQNNNNNDDNQDNNDNQNNANDSDTNPTKPVETNYTNINELIKAENIKEGLTVTTNSFHIKEGGAIYEIVKTTSQKVDGITVIALDNGLFAIYSDKNNEPTSKQFGAIGDGVSDDTEAITTLLNYSSQTITIDQGTYLITDTIYIDNSNNKIINAQNATITTKDSKIEIINSNNIQINGLKINNENLGITFISESDKLDNFQYIIKDSENIEINNSNIAINSNKPLIESVNSKNIKVMNSNIHYEFDELAVNEKTIFDGLIQFENNKITIKSKNVTSLINVFKNSDKILNNIINTDIKTNKLFDGINELSNNQVTINGITNYIINNSKTKVDNNTITISNMINSIINYDSSILNNNIIINNNVINNNYDEINNNYKSNFINIKNTLINNYNIEINNNVINGDNINNKGYLVLYEELDDQKQQIIINNNDTNNYTQRLTIGNDNSIIINPRVNKTASSVNAMKNDQSLTSGDVVNTIGYYEGTTTGSSYYRIIDTYPTISIRTNEVINLDNGNYALLYNTGEGISVNQFGAYGNGTTSDGNAIMQAFYSGYDYIYLEEGEYLSNQPITVSQISDVVFDGKNNLIYYDDNFDEVKYKDSYFIHCWKISNVDFVNLNIETRITKSAGINNQIQIFGSSNISIKDSRFYIMPGAKTGSTNIDLNSQWNDIVIDNNELINISDQDAGGSIWIRDTERKNSSGLIFTNNTVDKISHDEHLAIFLGTISDVYIANNKFTSTFGNSKTSIMPFSFGTAYETNIDNIIFEKNEIDVVSTGAIFFTKDESNTIIRDNDITFTKDELGYQTSLFVGKAQLVDNNNITVKISRGDTKYTDRILSGTNVTNNSVLIEGDAQYIFFKANNVINNTVTIQGNIEDIFNKTTYGGENTITINGKVNNIISWKYEDMTLPATIENNVINYNYDEINNNISSNFIGIDGIALNNNLLTVRNNTINAPNLNSQSMLYNIRITDSTPQNIIIDNNIYTSNTYQNQYINSNHTVTITP